jgi:hypothetical protein
MQAECERSGVRGASRESLFFCGASRSTPPFDRGGRLRPTGGSGPERPDGPVERSARSDPERRRHATLGRLLHAFALSRISRRPNLAEPSPRTSPRTQNKKISPHYPPKNPPFSLLLRAQGPSGAPPPDPVGGPICAARQPVPHLTPTPALHPAPQPSPLPQFSPKFPIAPPPHSRYSLLASRFSSSPNARICTKMHGFSNIHNPARPS